MTLLISRRSMGGSLAPGGGMPQVAPVAAMAILLLSKLIH